MFKLFKKKELKKPAMTYRIREIYRKLKFINQGKFGDFAFSTYWCSLDTCLGERKLLSSNNSLAYYDNRNKLFELDLYKGGTEVKLYPAPTSLTYEQIDLAILEFENSIDIDYKDMLEKMKYHKKVESILNVILN